MMLLVGVIALAVLMRLLPLWAAFLGAAAASMSRPTAMFSISATSALSKFRENFPDALDSLARALRAGYPLSAGMEMIRQETAPPVRAKFAALRPKPTWAAAGRMRSKIWANAFRCSKSTSSSPPCNCTRAPAAS